jgi:hypothetical protein
MSLGESFGVDFEIPAGGFCFSAFSFTGVGSDVGSHGQAFPPDNFLASNDVSTLLIFSWLLAFHF